MKRLKHPIRSIREPFGTAGLIVAMIALIAALGGTALAAAKLNGGQKKEVEKIAKKFAGKPGAAGAAGPAGAPGAKGANGANGANGSNGANGAGVTTKAIPTSGPTAAPCKNQGGTEFTSASGTEHVCNGTTGFTSTLPAGKTETGTWNVSYQALGKPGEGEEGEIAAFFSFPIPLLKAVSPTYVTSPTGTGECPGTEQEPQAEPGHFCVYQQVASKLTKLGFDCFGGENGQTRYGCIETFEPTEAGAVHAGGTWAVTAGE